MRTHGIFAVWWDRKYEHSTDADLVLSTLSSVREDCLTRLGMRDPPNPGKRLYYNVYIHHYKDDIFPDNWWVGQSEDEDGIPYLAMAYDALSILSIHHEAFHIFQFSSTSLGVRTQIIFSCHFIYQIQVFPTLVTANGSLKQ